MGKLTRDFIAVENRKYKFKIGQLVASSLSGFVAGTITASLVWIVALKYFKLLFL